VIGTSNCGSNHFARAPCPALIEARIRDENCQVVPAAITSPKCARRTPGHVVAPDDPGLGDIVENAKAFTARSQQGTIDRFNLRSRLCNVGWKLFPDGEAVQLVFGESAEKPQKPDLCFQRVIGTVKPKTALRGAMDSQWSSDGVAECTLLDLIMLGEDFDSFRQAGSLYWYSQFLRQVVDINSALFGQSGTAMKTQRWPPRLLISRAESTRSWVS
jgi:hypothetical protein